MVCGKGPSIGKETKRIGRSIDREFKRLDQSFGLRLDDPEQPKKTTEQQGFTEADKEKLRRRQSLRSTRLFTGLLSKGNVGRESLI